MFRVPLMPSLPDLLAGMIKLVDRSRTRQASATVETDADDCVEYGPGSRYDRGAARAAQEAVRAFLKDIFGQSIQ